MMIGGETTSSATSTRSFALCASPGDSTHSRREAIAARGARLPALWLKWCRHFVKMVHNGIEYGVMAAYAEGFGILRDANVASRPPD